MQLLARDIEEYARTHTTREAPSLAHAADRTLESMEESTMLSGVTVGRLLGALAFASGARRVLEIGTFTGYSALSIAEGLTDGGHIDTCELDPATARVAQEHIDASPHRERITLHVGPALETVARLDGPYDLVFIDADKQGYASYLDAVLPKLGERGVVAVDNTLWSGRVVSVDEEADADTVALAAFNDRVASDPDLVAVMLTVRDGVTLIHRRRGA